MIEGAESYDGSNRMQKPNFGADPPDRTDQPERREGSCRGGPIVDRRQDPSQGSGWWRLCL